ncbi:MAG: iron-containing alcohol dehydrogenase [Clostridiales bacterium]|jgi:alcohol dehydrogenase YqhD (iron-dependent ADH family)|nr:iron-containing alcohol dehydrogenase [Clostridiales bacterium]
MENFSFLNPTRIIFGRGTQSEAGAYAAKYGKKVLLHYGGGSIKRSGLYDQVVQSLSDAGLEFVELGGVQPNPRLTLAKKGIELARAEGVDFILAVGGGSVIDSAKCISIGVPYEGGVWDFYDRKAVPGKALGIGVVLTIPAAGSESSDSSVITNEDGPYKTGLSSDIFIPKFAILNPELTYTLPAYQTASGAADMLAHVMERYFTNARDVDLSDKLCEALMRAIIHNAPLAIKNPEDYNARAEIMWSATLAHNNLVGMGRVGDWASHHIQHELGAVYDMAHGAGLAIIFPAWMKYVCKHDVTRFAQFANKVFGVEYDFWNPENTALEGIARLERFFESIDMPIRLSQAGLPDIEANIPLMAKKATRKALQGQFVKLGAEDIEKIYHLAM